jgi:hypothetical protein
MKNLLLLLCVPFILQAGNKDELKYLNQVRWNYSQNNVLRENAIFWMGNANAAQKNNVATVKRFKVKKNGEKELIETKVYNKQGMIVERTYRDQKTTYKYNDTLLTSTFTQNKKSTFGSAFLYDNQQRLIHIKRFKNGKTRSETRYVYFEKNKLLSTEEIIYGKRTKVIRYETTFDEILKKPTAAFYYVNGQLIKKWDFSCQEQGEVIKKDEKQASECTYNQNNADGSYSIFKRIIEDKKLYLNRTDFTKDSIFIASYRYYNDNILISKSSFENNVSIYEAFTKKGKLKYKSIAKYDENKNILHSEYYNHRNKKRSNSTYNYIKNGLIQEYIANKNKLVFEYTFHSN